MTGEKKRVGDPTLPPPGDARREELRKREDNLTETAERISIEKEQFSIDPEAFNVDRELASKFNPATLSMLTVTKPQPGMAYCWANFANQHGVQVVRLKMSGWVVVSGSDLECTEHKIADGTRRIGDVLLMRMPQEKKDAKDAQLEIDRVRKEGAGTAELEELGRKYAHKGIKIHTPNTAPSAYGYRRTSIEHDPRRALVEKQAFAKLGEMSRDRIPGIPLPGEKGR
jgi:hypothetical protein